LEKKEDNQNKVVDTSGEAQESLNQKSDVESSLKAVDESKDSKLTSSTESDNLSDKADSSKNIDAEKKHDKVQDSNIDNDKTKVDNVDEHLSFVIGKKVGMTQLFDEDGSSYPVTVISVEPNTVTQLKTVSKDGYSSVQLGFETITEKNKSKAYIGKFKSAGVAVKSVLKEFRVESKIVDLVKVGSKVTVDAFNVGDIVDVSGVSKGKGFAGVMKRHGFGGGRRSHGKNSVMRKPGAIGASADPGRVWPGKAMAGRMGGENVTVRKLSILRVDSKLNRLFVNGSIPGANNGVVYIKS